ncbi:PREDICTED: dihydroorotate dehydrogenase (quinone), mitochondrial [Vollenhovia emeryi]|uniref:dihydroorotate dehydrogenase (quinone), mitochondrial n=1 Tax=Vollenhovia emeryi TaxID=411798 RepID=UPI0005F3BE62|nr:PREDICTED: dihydroorotate dehydrogenase (quinone), mitochondrial [Vollenhovia emeryi]XP_011878785.1 PREDICTED: dihydroorotate dehydrogenase (quinone), mitochondrial [Vollenhovia emeryi]XP_011878786.1 PREDICTED: dihydroorotate dehydrogenase (quinone), mitochondrial [Vollenhovia emeryi]XP_011878787.1 PREDICTED: dihydroorotate dehydrogenase (quinone), mitochondrial [Vollenhovia emeryi]
MAGRLSNKAKLRSFLTVTSSAVVLFGGISLYQGNERFYSDVAVPLVQLIDPETAHKLAVKALKYGLVPRQKTEDPASLRTTVLGMHFDNPIGMAAGFDKQGEAVQGLRNIGFSFVEIGSVTPKPQPGNPKPRVFRLPEDNAVVNRYGFNSVGHDVVWQRLKELKGSKSFNGILGVNLGMNKGTRDATQDYIDGIKRFKDVADYFVINVSSPNTLGLRSLQNRSNLEELLTRINAARELAGSRQPLLLKLAPDLSDSERQDVADVVLSKRSRVDGLILCNTTVTRPNLISPNKEESGGLSGAPLTDISTAMIADMYKRTGGSIPIIGVGGVFSGSDAYVKLRAGASLVQLYTSYIYNGPPIVGKIKRELCEILETNGFSSVTDAIGKDAKNK